MSIGIAKRSSTGSNQEITDSSIKRKLDNFKKELPFLYDHISSNVSYFEFISYYSSITNSIFGQPCKVFNAYIHFYSSFIHSRDLKNLLENHNFPLFSVQAKLEKGKMYILIVIEKREVA